MFTEYSILVKTHEDLGNYNFSSQLLTTISEWHGMHLSSCLISISTKASCATFVVVIPKE